MAKGQHLSGHQQKIVKRYYQNLDTISLNKLAELVSEIALCSGGTDAKKLDKLWERARLALAKIDANKVAVEKVLQNKDVKGLAVLVNGMM